MSSGNAIHFFNENINYILRNKKARVHWLISAIRSEKKLEGAINFIFCDDQFLLKLNKKYLKHDFYTDIITFDFSTSEQEVTGDVYISIERLKENARKYQVKIDDEIDRVLIHGILHLMGFADNTQKDKKLMTEKEDFYLDLR